MDKQKTIFEDTKLDVIDQMSLDLVVELKKEIKIVINVKQSAAAVMIVNLIGHDQKLNIETNLAEYSKLTILFINTGYNLDINEEVYIEERAKYKVAYSEMDEDKVKRVANYYLQGFQAEIELVSVALIKDQIHQEFNCHHLQKETVSFMQTYGVLLKQGDYYIKANGKIIKGASKSKSFQVSRVLTLGDKEKAKIVPLLLIDENDVEASHAMSIGQLDENQLYYMQSRGLTKNDALRLIAIGYLSPITSIIDDEKLKSYLTNIINKKVQETCLM